MEGASMTTGLFGGSQVVRDRFCWHLFWYAEMVEAFEIMAANFGDLHLTSPIIDKKYRIRS
jgi:hypothetical protein